MRKSYIYIITNLINGKMYIGQTVNLKNRWNEHCNNIEQAIDSAINKYSKECFYYDLLEVCPTNEANQKEIKWIEKYNTYKRRGYNCHIGGGVMHGENNPMYGLYGKENPRYGAKHTKESKDKISKAMSGEKNHFYGKSHTKEAREKMVKANKERNLSKKQRQKMSEAASKYMRSKSKLNKKIGQKIYKEYHTTNQTQQKLSKKYKVTQSVISRITLCKHWTTKHLKEVESNV